LIVLHHSLGIEQDEVNDPLLAFTRRIVGRRFQSFFDLYQYRLDETYVALVMGKVTFSPEGADSSPPRISMGRRKAPYLFMPIECLQFCTRVTSSLLIPLLWRRFTVTPSPARNRHYKLRVISYACERKTF
jgi:hypothetical protein